MHKSRYIMYMGDDVLASYNVFFIEMNVDDIRWNRIFSVILMSILHMYPQTRKLSSQSSESWC